MEDAPKLKPATMEGSWNIIQRTAAPTSPMPTTVMPMTPPLEKATRSAGLSPIRAAAAVRMLDLTAICMPTSPAAPDVIAPMT
jgi:hypothetical protein